MNQQELTRIDAFPKEKRWQIRVEWSTFLPGLFGDSKHDAAAASAWSPLVDELFRIRAFQDDWDGEGTEAPSQTLVDGAIALAQYLQVNGTPAADRVIAGVNGTIYFEWHTPLGYLEVEVTSPKDAEGRWVRKGADATEVIYLSRHS